MSEGLQSGGEEHGFIVGMRYEEDDSFVGEGAGWRWRRDERGEVPKQEEERREGKEQIARHLCGLRLQVGCL